MPVNLELNQTGFDGQRDEEGGYAPVSLGSTLLPDGRSRCHPSTKGFFYVMRRC